MLTIFICNITALSHHPSPCHSVIAFSTLVDIWFFFHTVLVHLNGNSEDWQSLSFKLFIWCMSLSWGDAPETFQEINPGFNLLKPM